MKKILWIILMAGLVFTFAGCAFLADLLAILAAPQGNVINAKTGDGVANVSVTITCLDTPAEGETAPGPFTATTTDTGYYTFAEVAYGNYELTATLDGYVFIKQVVSVSGLMQTLPDVVGFPYNADTDSANISLILMWNKDFQDVDAHLTCPNGVQSKEGITVAMPFADVYDYSVGLTYSFDQGDYYYGGFFADGGGYSLYSSGLVTPYAVAEAIAAGTDQTVYPNYDKVDDPNYREHIYWKNKQSLNEIVSSDPDNHTKAINLDVDDTNGRGPETITIAGIPYDDTFIASSTAGGGNTGLATIASGFYTWQGVMELYVDAYRSGDAVAAGDYLSQVDSGKSADVVIYVMQGDTVYGTYTIPTYTNMKTASVLRINMFLKTEGETVSEFFQVAPDIRILQSTDMIKGADNGVINLQGRTR